MTTKQIKTFDEFWPLYLKEHQNSKNRILHYIGTGLVHIILFYVFVTGAIRILSLLPILGYSFAWAGHFIFEKNKPTTFKHPIWSLIADFRMFYQAFQSFL